MMKYWQRISGWRGTLIIMGIVILAISMWYTNYLATRLSESERYKVDLYIRTHNELQSIEDLNADITYLTDILLQTGDIPLINTDLNDNILYANAFGADKDTNTVYLQKQLQRIQRDGPQPIINRSPMGSYKIYYKESRLLRLLTFFPIVQLLLLSAFIMVGFIGINAAKRAEQNRVWVGMAKETAHQLGTPISAILAWIEHLRETVTDAQGEIVEELRHDVGRLELIADRFSKIGSAPELERTDIRKELVDAQSYMEKRASRKVQFDFPEPNGTPVYARVNPHLFNWVLENILRNALDAMDGEGKITTTLYDEGGMIAIDISDTGKGIHPSHFKKVFNPGFTTKQRGWGLGLSLAKRIIEQYHRGRIFVKHSRPGEGTIFTIRLPKSE